MKFYLSILLIPLFSVLISATGCAEQKVSELRAKYGDKKTGKLTGAGGLKYEQLSELLPYLPQIPEFKVLACGSNKLTANDIVLISKIKQLQELRIRSTNLSSKDFAPLADLQNLKTLIIDTNNNVNDEIFETLSKMKLTSVDLRFTNIHGHNIEKLGNNPELKILKLNGTNCDDITAAKIAQFSQLQKLDMSDTKITETGVRSMLGMLQLEDPALGYYPKDKAIELATIAIANRQKARAAGQSTAPDNLAPFAASLEK